MRISEPVEIEDPRLISLSEAAQQELDAGHVTGAVILVGNRGQTVYRKAFGYRALKPHAEMMSVDTIFDLASLTKAVATATAVMQLRERGVVDLDAPAARYWPDFGRNGKAGITLRQLLTHTSGLRADVDPGKRWTGYHGALDAIAGDKPLRKPGAAFRYSDVNFIVLGEIVRRVSGMSLDEYCARNIFQPLGLSDTAFRPAFDRSRIAPSDSRRGEVQDPTSYRMGGVAGHAGLFSTADDLAAFARMLLDGGMGRNGRVLTQASVKALETAQPIAGSTTRRGLGWDMVSPYSKDHSAFPEGSFGHTGYTGTSLWLDPHSKTFLIVLTSRLHPDGKGNARPLRAKAATAVASKLALGSSAETLGFFGRETDHSAPGSGQADVAERVRTGLDVLAAQGFAPLQGKRIGVITNHTGIDADGRSIIDLLRQAPGVKLSAIFSPEHGLAGTLDEKIGSGRDAKTGLPVYSLYGDSKKPSAKSLQGIDALVYDIQDVGVRFYTYITTMAYAMEAAADAGIAFYVLDRPNPINASLVQGPVMEASLKSFTGYYPLPVRYGMTVGELAKLFNADNRIGAKLHVVEMQGYSRSSWFDQTALAWVNPSPNIRSLTEAILYPGVAIVEAANLSVGRGTDTPFELVGAPWISGQRLATELKRRNIAGVVFEPVRFEPRSDRFRGQRCEGVSIRLSDREAFDAPGLGLELAAALYRLYPDSFQINSTKGMFGARWIVDAVKQGKDAAEIRRQWQQGVVGFLALRAKYLIY